MHHLTELLKSHPDSGDFLPRRAAANAGWADRLLAEASVTNTPRQRAIIVSTPHVTVNLNPLEDRTLGETDRRQLRLAATNLLEHAVAGYTRTLAWVDRFPALAKDSRKPFVEKRREVYLRLGRNDEAAVDERELNANSASTQP